MGKYFFSEVDLKSSWDHVFSAFWQRYPNPFSKHVLTEDVIYREVTPDNKLISRRLLTKTNRLPRWAEKIFPTNLSRSVFIVEDTIVDPVIKTLTSFTWNLNHTRLMLIEEKCVYSINHDNQAWTQVTREAWISSGVFGFSRAIQEFGLARFKSNQVKAMKGLEYVLANMQGEQRCKTLKETARETTEKAKITARAATEKAKDLASPQKSKQFV
ncbi:PRELI domain-containing protein 1, mitochondrial-like [Latimeria chalumnae]|uniref:PRELI/MSF1 domain-containing protein n=1 Tax=Latimeria chalumnae TaxID=7897 RepID=H3AHX6_LATCH|nr:PREDICTED: PRELI domain-containing protein 1, mitochondrial-like [Latimeria chalumnae]XP_006007054.1 PREDICTED: PRELI domain-containing protein 1, mitochondrial-like [Latimeria chalumnae]XP_014350668.1 PREDICTED: PRELI domain-containing protein 1, mitochondrial-like [Latimeria chalumnae]XP_014350669.1 PREDICTED: PRELI domain-containing protein 1, mitochondrial-like [Latimeria chalumnae]|eukprot:XP_006007053.1 PREDICTED: PRELI domain-containing protein 1, mitochondrial-like [Latimeria chalumnae]